MASIVLIETNGTVKTLKTKELTVDTLYKKCGFRINEDFTCRHTWHVKLAGTNAAKEKYIISVWAKKTGKAGGENKYDFPPPIDKDLFFGTCAVVRTKDSEGINSNNDFLDLTKETWLKIYERLFGGFEDIGDEDEYSEDELENVDPSLLTKNGYLKDGFVVSDKELTSGAPSTEDEEDEVKEPAITVKKKTTKTKQAPVKEVKQKESKQKQAPKETKPAPVQKQKQTPKETKQAKQVQQKETPKQAKQTQPPAKEVSNSESEETTSELEEEVYTFSDDD